MEFMDEKIVELINTSREQERKDISSTRKEATNNTQSVDMKKALIRIDDETVPVTDVSILEDKVKLRIPKLFNLMAKELAAIKYPSENRPNLIFTDETTSINLAFSYTSTELDDSEMELFKDSMVEVIKKTQPAAKWLSEGVKEINGKTIGYLECITPALDEPIYNYMFFVVLEEKALMCTFNCLIDELEDWQPIAQGMMETLEIVEDKRGEGV